MTSIAGSTIAKARFFLDCADEAGKDERVSFCNHLEAAIVFARSVTFHLQKEFATQPEFANWYEEHQKSLAQNRLAHFLLEQRNYVLKEGPIATHRVIQMTVTAFVHASCSATITVIRGAPWYRRSLRILLEDATYPLRERLHRFREERRQERAQKLIARDSPPDTTRDDIYFSHDEWKAEPAIELVRRLLGELEVIVRQAEQKFILGEAGGY
jgi:hypothetical protein